MKFGNQILDFGYVESARRNEKDVIRFDGSVLRHYRTALYDGEYVALNALARNVRAVVALARNLVDFVDEYDAVVFRAPYRLGIDRVVVDKFVRFLRHNKVFGFAHGDFTLLFLVHAHTAENRTEVDCRPAPRRKLQRLGNVLYVNFNNGTVVLARVDIVYEVLLEHFLCRFTALALLLLGENFGNPALGRRRGAVADFRRFFFLYEPDCALRKVAHHRFHVPADVADLGIFSRLDFEERRLDEFCKPSGNLRLAHARGALHYNVLGGYFFLKFGGKTASPVTVAKGYRNGLLRVRLSYDVFIQFVNYLLGSQIHSIPP